MKSFLLLAALLCAPLCAPLYAAPRDVTVTLKPADGKVLPPSVKFHVFDDVKTVSRGEVKGGKAVLPLEDGFYSLLLDADAQAGVPGAVWGSLEVKEGKANWELKLPIIAAVQGRILLPNGKPASECRIWAQTGAWAASSAPFRWADGKENNGFGLIDMTRHLRGAKHAYASTNTATDGTFTLSGLVPANFSLDVYEPQSKTHFTIPFAPALKADAEKGVPTKIGDWIVPQNGWDWLFDAKLHHNGEPSKFDGQGEMKIENGTLRLNIGKDLTGVTWNDATLPRENYEISFDARRVAGNDFFCGLTFPVGEKPLSWIVGGWGGTIVGLSSINGSGADENETTQTRDFESGQWYRLRLRVSKAKIETWIDSDKMVDLTRAEKEFSIRYSVEPSQPLGIATWRTGGELRDIRIRRLDAEEVATIERTVANNP